MEQTLIQLSYVAGGIGFGLVLIRFVARLGNSGK